MVEVMEQRLAAKKRELEQQQEYFRIDIKIWIQQHMRIMQSVHYWKLKN